MWKSCRSLLLSPTIGASTVKADLFKFDIEDAH
jgi:hypothetical protein